MSLTTSLWQRFEKDMLWTFTLKSSISLNYRRFPITYHYLFPFLLDGPGKYSNRGSDFIVWLCWAFWEIPVIEGTNFLTTYKIH